MNLVTQVFALIAALTHIVAGALERFFYERPIVARRPGPGTSARDRSAGYGSALIQNRHMNLRGGT
ncbi:hypothetical protein [Streptomyces sp. R41]|uniref:Uncharacterized protein n=1 Tax=Streptomyces sp. R41 TaxID=3238632 RepID=A0AB39RWH5_9ACTN